MPDPNPAANPSPDPNPSASPDPNPDPNPSASPDPNPTPPSAGGNEPDPTQPSPIFDFDKLDENQKKIVARKHWEGLDDPVKLLNDYIALETRVGADNIAAPKDGNFSDFYRANAEAFGVPDSADGYEIDRGDIPADQWNGEGEKAFREFAHARGLPQHVVSDVMNYMLDRYKAETEAGETGYKTAVAAERKALDAEWGQAKDQNMEIARQAGAWAGLEPADIDALQSVIGHKRVFMALHKIGEGLGEDTLKAGGGSGGFGNALTPDQASAEISRMLGDEKVAASLNDKLHPDHKANTERWRQLEAIRAAGRQA